MRSACNGKGIVTNGELKSWDKLRIKFEIFLGDTR